MHEPENGRATIRETYRLITESRAETEAQLDRAEQRLMAAIYSSEARVIEAMGGLASRVVMLEEWRSDMERIRAVKVAERDGRWWFPHAVMKWADTHWRVLTVVFLLIIAIVTVLADIRITLSQ